MISLFSYLAVVLIFTALMLLAIDSKIYSANGWFREKKLASVLGWIYGGLSILIIAGLIIVM